MLALLFVFLASLGTSHSSKVLLLPLPQDNSPIFLFRTIYDELQSRGHDAYVSCSDYPPTLFMFSERVLLGQFSRAKLISFTKILDLCYKSRSLEPSSPVQFASLPCNSSSYRLGIYQNLPVRTVESTSSTLLTRPTQWIWKPSLG